MLVPYVKPHSGSLCYCSLHTQCGSHEGRMSGSLLTAPELGFPKGGHSDELWGQPCSHCPRAPRHGGRLVVAPGKDSMEARRLRQRKPSSRSSAQREQPAGSGVHRPPGGGRSSPAGAPPRPSWPRPARLCLPKAPPPRGPLWRGLLDRLRVTRAQPGPSAEPGPDAPSVQVAFCLHPHSLTTSRPGPRP